MCLHQREGSDDRASHRSLEIGVIIIAKIVVLVHKSKSVVGQIEIRRSRRDKVPTCLYIKRCPCQ